MNFDRNNFCIKFSDSVEGKNFLSVNFKLLQSNFFIELYEKQNLRTKNIMAEKVDMSNADFEGYLTKQSAWLKEWRKRYFLLKENQLHFCKTSDSQPHGTIDLKECLTVKSAEEKTGKRYVYR